jgi:hypothetical protein
MDHRSRGRADALPFVISAKPADLALRSFNVYPLNLIVLRTLADLPNLSNKSPFNAIIFPLICGLGMHQGLLTSAERVESE